MCATQCKVKGGEEIPAHGTQCSRQRAVFSCEDVQQEKLGLYADTGALRGVRRSLTEIVLKL